MSQKRGTYTCKHLDDMRPILKAAFPSVRYFRWPEKDFKAFFLKTFFESEANYLLLGTSDLIVKDTIDLNACCEKLDRTDAYAFQLSLGSAIQPRIGQMNLLLNPDLYASFWESSQCMDMAIYRKSDLKNCLIKGRYKNPTELSAIWPRYMPEKPIALTFEHSKVLSVPLNAAKEPRLANSMTAEELLLRFNQGTKIDIDPFFQIENPSPYFEGAPSFVLR